MFNRITETPAGKCPYCGEKMVKHIVKEGARYHVTSWDTLGAHCSTPNCEHNHNRGQCVGRERRNSRVIGRDHDPRAYEIVGKVPEYERW